MAGSIGALGSIASFLGPIGSILGGINAIGSLFGGGGLLGGQEEDSEPAFAPVSAPLPSALTSPESIAEAERRAAEAVEAEQAGFEGLTQGQVEEQRRRRLLQQGAFSPEGIGAVITTGTDRVDVGGAA